MSLKQISHKGGIEETINRHKIMEDKVRRGLSEMNIKIPVDSGFKSNCITPAVIQDLDVNILRDELINQYGIMVAGAQVQYWKKNFIRIGHMGYVNNNDMSRFLRSLRIVIESFSD